MDVGGDGKGGKAETGLKSQWRESLGKREREREKPRERERERAEGKSANERERESRDIVESPLAY